MPEVASEIGDGLHAIADALNTLAGAIAWMAVERNSPSHGRQCEMAAVVMRFAKEGYWRAKVDGERVSEADSEQARVMLEKLFGPPKPFKGITRT